MVPGFLESLPLIGALAITRTLRQEYVVNATVRWPNDVVVDWQKIAGVLVESKTKGNELLYAILGLGINANFDTEAISPTGVRLVSLLALLGAPVNREHLIAMVLSETEKVCGSLQNSENDVIAQLRELDCSRGHRVRVKLLEREIAGTVEDYETLSKVRIRSRKGVETVETDELVSVDYQSD
jgi:BirA family biotin operon repressor/biotin-[acetyl-CoA-carboxylase] ligase